MNTRTDLHLGDFTASASVYGNQAIPRYYGEALLELAGENPNVVCLGCDLSASTETDLFRDRLPERFFMIGMQEANAVGTAAGMARMGDIPFVHSFGVFMSRRPYDQIAMQLAYPKTNVKLVGFLPGLTTLLGVSHQAIEDIALMRALPNMTVVEPCGPAQIRAAVRAVAAHPGPVYLRMERPATPLAEGEEPLELHIGRAQTLREGADVAIFACGLMVPKALQAAEQLRAQGVQAAVINMHTIKPLDRDAVLTRARQCRAIVTAENHSIIGGLGTAVAEVLAESAMACRFARVGVADTFAQGGSTPFLQQQYGLTAEHIARAASGLLGGAHV
ncbi:transketolase C-terminal domain-containing protein [Pseudomonas kuykendallii]|uniref:transketolase family protein n=1 Tax=Pseudomonas kuykendallii TaxID=1007099 RepID=UPI0028D5D93B|nr:transketolase C-terminal domain-containing protein [Pseudomonas kuykendallii]